MPFKTYFTDYTIRKGILYGAILLFVFGLVIISILEPWLTPESCRQRLGGDSMVFENALYVYNPCLFQRQSYLLWFTPEECSFARRLWSSVILGGIIGWERRQADRPAGIRTMALVSLGSALFTINSAYAFVSGPMAWDASRISAAIPSGVGFLGAGLIFKEAEKNELTGGVTHVVHGLTTSASLWLSAAVGVACGGGLYMAASMSVAIMLVLLRFGPRSEEPMSGFFDDNEAEFNETAHGDVGDDNVNKASEGTPLFRSPSIGGGYAVVPPAEGGPAGGDERSEASSTWARQRAMNLSLRHRPQLGGIM